MIVQYDLLYKHYINIHLFNDPRIHLITIIKTAIPAPVPAQLPQQPPHQSLLPKFNNLTKTALILIHPYPIPIPKDKINN